MGGDILTHETVVSEAEAERRVTDLLRALGMVEERERAKQGNRSGHGAWTKAVCRLFPYPRTWRSWHHIFNNGSPIQVLLG
ncbi:unnamed protein product [Urochloa humidicola]